ncbi:unnamed protein product [Orchesella dallaii]|uniref:C2H2-type domain-containing protein n=1 Tax=Orchesella dallaii TaxID=48710 RepID=A0ABP1RUX0_9HEXA
MDGIDFVMDLSVRNSSCLSTAPSSGPTQGTEVSNQVSTIVRPIPRPPWSIVWYQNLWSLTTASARFPTPGQSLESENPRHGEVFNSFKEKSGSIGTTNPTPDSNQPLHSPRNERPSNQQQQCKVSTEAHSNDDKGGERKDFTTSSSHAPLYCKVREAQTQYSNRSCTRFSKSECENNDENNELCSSDNEEDEGSSSTHNVVTSSSTSAESVSSLSSSINDNNNGCSTSAMSLQKADLRGNLGPNHNQLHNQHDATSSVVLDIACCDGPVKFKRVSNPNFALTVEHTDVGIASPKHKNNGNGTDPTEYSKDKNKGGQEFTTGYSNNSHAKSSAKSISETTPSTTSLKTYLCIYCNQSFKSLFCYQKHKKRHLNPVSVDITTTTTVSNLVAPRASHHFSGAVNRAPLGGTGSRSTAATRGGSISESTKAKMKDLNVQFFPCKKCGCKFPSYYFVHKHRKICH